MLYPSIDELKKRADSRYTLVMIASKRARDLIDGYPSLVNIGNEKPVSIATEEIAEDMISYSRRTLLNNEAELADYAMTSDTALSGNHSLETIEDQEPAEVESGWEMDEETSENDSDSENGTEIDSIEIVEENTEHEE